MTEELGSEVNVIFGIDTPPVRHPSISSTEVEQADDAFALIGRKSLWTARIAGRSQVLPGQRLNLAVDTARLHYFDPVSGLSIGHPDAVAEAADSPA